MPTHSLDTFFACTILVAAALIATAFLTSTMQARIDSTQNINKDNYLKAIADQIITSPGTPHNWGTSSGLPQDFGLAQSQSTTPYELDADKISRLNSQNNHSLAYADIAQAAKLTNIALGIRVSPLLSVSIQQSENHSNGDQISFTFGVSTTIDSKPADASLCCYVVAKNYLSNHTDSTSNGVGDLTVEIPTSATDNALLVVFARASFDERITSYAVYSFADSAQQTAPSNEVVALSTNDYTLSFTPAFPSVTVQNGYLFSYMYQSNLTSPSSAACPIPRTIDKSPFVIVVYGQNGTGYFEEWVSYPQVPLTAGSSFEGSERNIFSYIVTIKGALYKVNLSFGGLAR